MNSKQRNKSKNPKRRFLPVVLGCFLLGQALVVNTTLLNRWKEFQKQLDRSVESTSSPEASVETNSQTGYYNYSSLEEELNRSSRFPSVEARVRYYMSSWYAPPCDSFNDTYPSVVQYQWLPTQSSSISDQTVKRALFRELPHDQTGESRVLEIDNELQPSDGIFFVDMVDKNQSRRMLSQPNVFMRHYAKDAVQTLFSIPSSEVLYDDGTPLLMQWGDTETSAIRPAKAQPYISPSLPHLKKSRAAFATSDNETVQDVLDLLTSAECYEGAQRPRLPAAYGRVRLQPILWKLNTGRHFGPIDHVSSHDIPWHEKKNQAVFRGGLNGKTPPDVLLWNFTELCNVLPRCSIWRQYRTSSLVDARLTYLPTGTWPQVFKNSSEFWSLVKTDTRRTDLQPGEWWSWLKGLFKDPTKRKTYFGHDLDMPSLLQYKMLIVLEGNDVASGLKWALLSNSVVMMPPSTATSWVMEELLQPWVHYVPLYTNLTNVEEQVQWVLDHEKEAQQISHRGSLWMKDLMFHPQAAQDEAAVYKEILERYRVHFRRVDSLNS